MKNNYSFLRQLDNTFYQSVDKFREEIKIAQLMKAAEKYENPFNPDHWTGAQLAEHAMQENFDQSVYITGLRDKVIRQETTINYLMVVMQKLAEHDDAAKEAFETIQSETKWGTR
ncbi:hypothetical protein A374_08869 [Fictibacillus macauensis ZFHKF-1]|uniref:Uncharacterized protein n=1 Tax=Fictibacillus macauensis ZFHKF-1 TaxID=1196324 RepID=I8UGB3_9BACL|nr:hypothetical protein [Fictibacillus macauensis]EIT85935.1 hypothetical protein A374_08869 [Fictibacillus macauensis ZFHKF-1]